MLQVVKGIILILYILDCVVLNIVVVLQESKQPGLTGAISGVAESYWGKNKGRSMEGGLVLTTRITAVVFIVLSLVLNLGIFA